MGDLTNRGADTSAWDYSYPTVISLGMAKGDIASGMPMLLDDGDARYVYGVAGCVSQIDLTDTYYYLGDGLGSTMKTTDDDGDVVNAYEYDVYGNITTSSGGQANEFEFAGEQTGPNDLQYLRARYYDPTAGTFASRDPLSSGMRWGGHSGGYLYRLRESLPRQCPKMP